MELDTALKLVNHLVLTKIGRTLRDPELAFLRGTWSGLTYEQMAESSPYSNNYLMRDVAPKLLRGLTDALGEPVTKATLRTTIERLAPAGTAIARPPNDRPPIRREPAQSYGRAPELATLTQWLIAEKCQLVGIWGLSGVGKTTLVKMLIEQIHHQFEVVVWRSLKLAPTRADLTAILPEDLAAQSTSPESTAAQAAPRRLLVLTESEAILQPAQTAGHYQAGYENYRDLWLRLGESPYAGCVIVLGLEPLRELTRLAGMTATVRSLELTGLTPPAAEPILAAERLVPSPQWAALVAYYGGHPAALRTAARIIRNLFSGSVGEFLKQQSFLFEEINERLAQSFQRLSNLEQEILYWLASEAQPATLATLQQRSGAVIAPIALLEALDSLKQRSLLEIRPTDEAVLFTLPPMVRDYVVQQFLAQVRSLPTVPDPWSLPPLRQTLALSPPVVKPVHLSEWLQQRFEADWQPVERLFTVPLPAPQRLRSAFHLRGANIIKRFKAIALAPPTVVVLLVAINQEVDQSINICVQVQSQHEGVLPGQLKLSLLDMTAQTLAEIIAQPQDNFMQLPYFRGVAQETFAVQLTLDAVSHREKFMI